MKANGELVLLSSVSSSQQWLHTSQNFNQRLSFQVRWPCVSTFSSLQSFGLHLLNQSSQQIFRNVLMIKLIQQTDTASICNSVKLQFIVHHCSAVSLKSSLLKWSSFIETPGTCSYQVSFTCLSMPSVAMLMEQVSIQPHLTGATSGSPLLVTLFKLQSSTS